MSNLPEAYTALTYTAPLSTPHLTHSALNPPNSNELVIKIHAATINPIDIQLWGNPVIGFFAGKKEKGIGRDYSGTIVAVGDSLKSKWEVGDEVLGLRLNPVGSGTFTDYLTVSSSDPIARKPRKFTFHEAAAVPLVVLTTFTCLDWLPSEDPKQGKRRVVVSGASGGVGMWCVQLAKKLYNCHVTAVCSGRNIDFVKDLGADEVIDYTEQNVAQTLLNAMPDGRKYDLYIDCVGGVDMFNHWTSLLHRSAAYVTMVGDKTARTSLGGTFTYLNRPAQVLRFIRGFIFGPRYANIDLYMRSELLERFVDLVERDEVKIVIEEVVEGILKEESSEEAWKKVYKYMEEGRVRGKVVVDVL